MTVNLSAMLTLIAGYLPVLWYVIRLERRITAAETSIDRSTIDERLLRSIESRLAAIETELRIRNGTTIQAGSSC